MRPIVLSGFMATGKSTLGPLLASRLGVQFLDIDEEIARERGKSIAALWRDEGEAAFRRREAETIERVLGAPSAGVVAFGGGAVADRTTRHRALERATVVTLTATPSTILERIGAAVADRPNLLEGGDPRARAQALLEARAEAYAECHATLATDGADPESLVDAIAAVARREPIAMPLGHRTYAIDVGRGAPALLTDAIARLAPSSLVVVTDAHVQRDRHAAIDAALSPLTSPRTTVTLPAGEEHKTLASIGTIWDAALGAGLDRDALVVAIGGGVVGDLAGFAAATLLRGVRSFIVPTTLLAMVDASVGGKTGFDHPTGKNLLGAFHQPSGVVIDLAHLETLPRRERVAGLAEVVKIALSLDVGLLDLLERDADAIGRGEPEVLEQIVRRAAMGKVRVVRDDERELGVRAILNVGHTVGHALEAHGRFRKYLHGEAVALGCVAELSATARLGLTPASLVERATVLLRRLGLPASVERAEVLSAWPYVLSDKKRAHTRIRLPIVVEAGRSRVDVVPVSDLREAVLASL